MRRKSLWKQAISVMLAMIMFLSLPSQTVLAEEMSDIVSTELTETLEATETEEVQAETEVVGTEKIIDTEVIDINIEENTETERIEIGTESTEIEVSDTTEVTEIQELEVVEAERKGVAEDFSYVVEEDGTVTIIGYQGNDTTVVIPETIDGKNVTSIGDLAFFYCNNITSINIPTSVTNIGIGAFQSCGSLTNINIPVNTVKIGKGAFSGCTSLKSIEIPASVTSIGEDAFMFCSRLTSIEIPASVTSIGSNAFSGCSEGLTSIIVDEGNTTYNSGAGSNCIIETATNALIVGCKNTVIPTGVTSIKDSAFKGCSKLKNIKLPTSITSIEQSAFSGCSGLTNIEIPTSVTNIGKNAFEFCSNLISVEIPKSVTNMGNNAFWYCRSLTSIEIPASVTSIGIGEFAGCWNLTSIKIPTSVANIENDAFDGCDNIVIYCAKNSYARQYAIENDISYKSLEEWKVVAYTVRFSGNNADSGSMTDQSITYGSGSILRANTFQKKGYTFKNWNTKADGSGISLANKADGSKLTQTAGAVVTLYAQWTKTKYSISYNLNNGTNSKDNPSSYDIKTNTITLKDASRKGYTFNGWYTDKNYKKKITQIKKGSIGNITLYAKWTVNSYTIIFDGNGSTSGSMKKLSGCKYGKTYTLTKNGFKKKGYTFKGWRTSKNGDGKIYKNQAEIKNLSAKSGGKVTLYAQWSKTKYTITYKLNKGTNSKSNPSSYTITTKTIKLKNPTRKGYTFKGWYSDKKCTKKVTQIKKGSTGNITLYAKWVKKK